MTGIWYYVVMGLALVATAVICGALWADARRFSRRLAAEQRTTAELRKQMEVAMRIGMKGRLVELDDKRRTMLLGVGWPSDTMYLAEQLPNGEVRLVPLRSDTNGALVPIRQLYDYREDRHG